MILKPHLENNSQNQSKMYHLYEIIYLMNFTFCFNHDLFKGRSQPSLTYLLFRIVQIIALNNSWLEAHSFKFKLFDWLPKSHGLFPFADWMNTT